MSDPNTIRIISFDGGGERGYLSACWFKKFIQAWGIDPLTLAQRVDVICGTSVGGIIGLALAFGKTIEEISTLFVEQGPYIFSLGTYLIPPPVTAPSPSIRPNRVDKIALLLANIPFYQSSGTYEHEYGAGLLYSTLEAYFGTKTLQDLQTNVIIPAYEQDTQRYVLFSNRDWPDFIGQDETIVNVAKATSAAPAYLPPVTFNGHTYLDGGIYQNNPAQFGRTLAQMLKKSAIKCCVLSVGTGIGEKGFDSGGALIAARALSHLVTAGTLMLDDDSIINTLFSLFEIASYGGQESVAKNMYLESAYTDNWFYTYRFQPFLDPNLNTELDNTDPDILEYYSSYADETFDEDYENIESFLDHWRA